jgi:AmmeMemoRadiSam system protein B
MNEDFLPAIREDIIIRQESFEGEDFIILSDPQGISPEDISIPLGFLPLVQALDGRATYEDIKEYLESAGIDSKQIMPLFDKIVRALDIYAMLDNETYENEKRKIESYLESPTRASCLSGIAYPENKEELEEELDLILHSFPGETKIQGAKALIAPHIDFRTAMSARMCYSTAYKSISDTEADLYVILGVSHNVPGDHFMATYKNFETPLGIVETDKELLDEIIKSEPDTELINDMAHRLEHSIELQCVLLQRKFRNKDFKILPILCGHPHEMIYSDDRKNQFEMYYRHINTIKNAIEKLGRKAVFIASADLAHIGPKHSSPINAEENLELLENEDRALISTLENQNPDKFYDKIKTEKGKWQICGAAPIYALLNLVNYKEATLEYYGQWLEKEIDSAVSYSSVSFF